MGSSNSFEVKFMDLVNTMPMSRFHRQIIESRYVRLVTKSEREYLFVKIVYYILTSIVTIAGVSIAALISLEKYAGLNTEAVFWVTFGFSLALALANKWLFSFSINKKYILGKSLVEKLHTEGWSFVAGIGKYTSKDMDERFTAFCKRVERIKMKSVSSMPELEAAELVSGIIAASANTVTANTGVLTDEIIDDRVDLLNVVAEDTVDGVPNRHPIKHAMSSAPICPQLDISDHIADDTNDILIPVSTLDTGIIPAAEMTSESSDSPQ